MGGVLTKDTANIKFREQLRRTTTEVASIAHDIAAPLAPDMDERTPLVGVLPGTAASRSTSHGTLWHVLLDRKHTPGTNSEKLAIKWLAKLWHVTKVSLYSSMYHLTRPPGNKKQPSSPLVRLTLCCKALSTFFLSLSLWALPPES